MPPDVPEAADESPLVSALTQVVERRVAHSLVASDGVSERIFYFAIGGIRVIRSGPRKTPSVADILLDSGRLSAGDVGRVVAASKRDGHLFGEAVAALGLLEQPDLEDALRTKVQEEVLDLFIWDGVEIRLHEGQPPKSAYEGRFESARLTCDVPAFVQAVLTRVDEWRSITGQLPTLREVLEASEVARGEQPDGPRRKMLGELNGTRTLGEAIARSGMRRVAAYEFTLDLLRASKVRRVTSTAAQKVAREEVVREIEVLQESMKTAVDSTIVKARLARSLETIGDNSRAAQEWRSLGDGARRAGDPDRALDCYRRAVAIVPTDFATRELILEIHRQAHDHAQLLADGRPLAELFVKHNLLNRAKLLLAHLVGIEPQETALRRQLITVLIGLGERDGALKQLRELAKILEQAHASTAELRDIYVRILAFDKSDEQARDRLDTITGVKLQRRVFRLTIAASVLAMLLLGGWYLSEGSARREVSAAIETSRSQTARGDFAAAKETLRRAAESCSYSQAGSAAINLAEQIERIEVRERERLAAGEQLTRTSAQKDEAAAQTMLQQARDQAHSGKPDEADATLRELFSVFGDVPLVAAASLETRLTVLPVDARVQLGGEEVGQGTAVVRYTPKAKSVLTVEREGYQKFEQVLDGPQPVEMTVQLERPTRWTFRTDAAIDAPPLVTGGLVYVAGRDRCLTAMSCADGAVQWRTPLGFYADSAVRPVATSTGLVVATASGEAVCINPLTGEVMWRRDLGTPCERALAAGGPDAVVVTGNDGSVRALRGSDGGDAWVLPANSLSAAPVQVDDVTLAYVDARGALAFASRADGKQLPGYVQPATLKGTPVVEDGRIWVRATDGSLHVVSAASRRAVVRCPVTSAADVAPAVAGDTAYALSSDGAVTAIRAGGDTLFRARCGDAPSAAPVVSKGRLYVPCASGRLHVLDASTGAMVWSFDAKSRITATPVIVDGTIYVATAAGRLFAIAE
jgi:outer membrane protein assembly factor BamB